MPDEIKWIKLSTDFFEDRKIKQIRAMPDGDAMLLVWLNLLVLAGLVNDGGLVYLTRGIPYTDEMLAEEMRRSIPVVRSAISLFRTLNMVEDTPDGLLISNWEKHQSVDGMTRIREQTRKRVADYRARQKAIPDVTSNVTCNATVTQSNATDIDIEEDKDKDKDKEYINTTPPRNNDTEKGFSKQVQAGAGVNDILRGGDENGGDTARACRSGEAQSVRTGCYAGERAEAGENRLRTGTGTEKPLDWRDLSKDRLH